MPKKYYTIKLSDEAEIHVYFETANGLIISFMVKLIMRIGNTIHEVIRFDSAHQCPHKDILNIDGTVKRKIWFQLLDNKQALDMAVRDVNDNAEIYIERYKKWLRK